MLTLDDREPKRTTLTVRFFPGYRLRRVKTIRYDSIQSAEGLGSDLGLPEDQGVHVVDPLVGVDRLQVLDVADHVMLVGDSVAAVPVGASGAGILRNSL